MKVDPSGHLLHSFIDLNNLALSRFSTEERQRIGVHTCPGGDRDSTHSADVDYAELLPSLFQLRVGNFYIALAGERDRAHVLRIIRQYMKPDHRVFVGVVAPIDPHIETPRKCGTASSKRRSTFRSTQLGTTDDCGFSPFCDDTSTTRDTAFAKIRARVLGTSSRGRGARSTVVANTGRRGTSCCGRSRCRTPAAFCSPASAPRKSSSDQGGPARERGAAAGDLQSGGGRDRGGGARRALRRHEPEVLGHSRLQRRRAPTPDVPRRSPTPTICRTTTAAVRQLLAGSDSGVLAREALPAQGRVHRVEPDDASRCSRMPPASPQRFIGVIEDITAAEAGRRGVAGRDAHPRAAQRDGQDTGVEARPARARPGGDGRRDAVERRPVRRVLLQHHRRERRRVPALHALWRAAGGVREVREAARDGAVRPDISRRSADPMRRRARRILATERWRPTTACPKAICRCAATWPCRSGRAPAR